MPPITLEKKERFGRGKEYLSGVRVEDISVKDLEELRGEKYHVVESIDLSGNDLTKKGVVAALSRVFTLHYGMKELNLAGCKLGELTADDFKLFFEKLKDRKLEALDLSSNGIGKLEQERVLVDFVKANNIRVIDLSNNGLEYFAAEALLATLSDVKLQPGQKKFQINLADNPDISESQRLQLAKQYPSIEVKFERDPETSRVATIKSHNLAASSTQRKPTGISASNA